jgi:hypothetical protein
MHPYPFPTDGEAIRAAAAQIHFPTLDTRAKVDNELALMRATAQDYPNDPDIKAQVRMLEDQRARLVV